MAELKGTKLDREVSDYRGEFVRTEGLFIDNKEQTLDGIAKAKFSRQITRYGEWLTNLTKRGLLAKTQLYYFYNTVYFTPEVIEVEDITKERTYQVSIWNATFKPVTIQNINFNGKSGLIIQEPANKVLQPLETKTINITIPALVTGNINEEINFTFSNGEVRRLKIVASATNHFLFIPEHNWSEELEFKTAVSQSTNRELRAKIGAEPIRRFKYNYKVFDKHLLPLMENLRNAQSKTYIVPMWEEMEVAGYIPQGALTLPISEFRIGYKVGSYVSIYDSDDYQFVSEIVSLTNTSVTLKNPVPRTIERCTITPMRLCYIMDAVGVNREWYNNVSSFNITYTQYNTDIPKVEIPYAVLAGRYVFDEYTDLSNHEHSQKLMFLNDTFALPTIHVEQSRGLWRSSIHIMATNRKRYHEWLAFFNYISGSFKSFWLPDWGNELLITKTTSSGSGYLPIQSNIKFDNIERYAIRIENNGKKWYFTLKEFTQYEGEFRLIFNGTLQETIKPTDKYKICLMRRVRLNDDKVTLEHNTFYDVKCNLSVSEIL